MIKNIRIRTARAVMLGVVMLLVQSGQAQRLLTLDSCRAMALKNNKQMGVSKAKQDVATNLRKSARTMYLPNISAVGGYMWTSKEISILTDAQKAALGGLGTSAVTSLQGTLGTLISGLPAAAQAKIANDMATMAGNLNQTGQHVVDAMRTDTRNVFAGAVVVTQPIFMGGAIVAMNKMADIGEELAANSLEAKRQNTLFHIDQAYWQVVSLRHKERLAQSFLELVKKLDSDVEKMVTEGVATKSDRLSVSVKVNEAEMALTKVQDGLVLSKMLLCQLCGLSLDEEILLADEDVDELATEDIVPLIDTEEAVSNRPEIRMLQNTVDLSRQATNVLKAGNLPQVLLVGGYSISNPNVFNGFEKKFGGMWNIGVLVRVPVWNWGDVAYKVRASKGVTTIAGLEMNEAREKIELQISQSRFRVTEAGKKLDMARTNIKRAEENLRTANLGFSEGVIQPVTVMEAQTAWLQAMSQKIDAEIDVKLSQVNLRKAMGVLK